MFTEDGLEIHAFTMQLKPGIAVEYKKRHDEIWPEMVEELKKAGICDYSIFLDEETGKLFAVLKRKKDHQMDALPQKEIVQKWWKWNAPLMDVKPDNEPISRALNQVFFLP